MSASALASCDSPVTCARCRIPLDSRSFDVTGFGDPPELGGTRRLARFQLPSLYCGVLEYFSQYSDALARDPSRIETPDLAWQVVLNGRPLDPYIDLRAIVNPWGGCSFPVWIRLDPSATLDLVVRRAAAAPAEAPVTRLGGRLVGRYWYDPSYGDVVRRRS